MTDNLGSNHAGCGTATLDATTVLGTHLDATAFLDATALSDATFSSTPPVSSSISLDATGKRPSPPAAARNAPPAAAACEALSAVFQAVLLAVHMLLAVLHTCFTLCFARCVSREGIAGSAHTLHARIPQHVSRGQLHSVKHALL